MGVAEPSGCSYQTHVATRLFNFHKRTSIKNCTANVSEVTEPYEPQKGFELHVHANACINGMDVTVLEQDTRKKRQDLAMV